MSDTRPTFGEHEFRKATRSEPHRECVRVARAGGWTEVRDDKTAFGAPDDRRLVFTVSAWAGFTGAVQDPATH